MRYIIATFFTLLIGATILTFTANVSSAQESMGEFLNNAAGEAGYNTEETGGEEGFARVAGRITAIFLSLLGVIFLIYTIYGGFVWMTAAGSEEKVTNAKKIIVGGIIGLLVVLGSYAIYLFIKEALL